MTRISRNDIYKRLEDDFLGSQILDNSLRGYWCEAMLAEALKPECRIDSNGWHPWDLQIGEDSFQFPDRIRIQVKNSANRQLWHSNSDPESRAIFNLTYRHLPKYFLRDNPQFKCEPQGFLCDLFALCHHPLTGAEADHTDPSQWLVYLLPVVGEKTGVTTTELAWLRDKLAKTGKSSSAQRRPETLKRGIRGRPAIQPIKASDLCLRSIFEALGIPDTIWM